MALCLAGEEHGGTSDKLTGFYFGTITLVSFFILLPLFFHTHKYTPLHLSPGTTTNSDSCGSIRQRSRWTQPPLNTSSAFAPLNHTQEVTANSLRNIGEHWNPVGSSAFAYWYNYYEGLTYLERYERVILLKGNNNQ